MLICSGSSSYTMLDRQQYILYLDVPTMKTTNQFWSRLGRPSERERTQMEQTRQMSAKGTYTQTYKHTLNKQRKKQTNTNKQTNQQTNQPTNQPNQTKPNHTTQHNTKHTHTQKTTNTTQNKTKQTNKQTNKRSSQSQPSVCEENSTNNPPKKKDTKNNTKQPDMFGWFGSMSLWSSHECKLSICGRGAE